MQTCSLVYIHPVHYELAEEPYEEPDRCLDLFY